MKRMIVAIVMLFALMPVVGSADTPSGADGGTMTTAARPAWIDSSSKEMEDALVARFGEPARSRAARGLEQVASLWLENDGDAAAFESFVSANFAGDEATYKTLLSRMDSLHEQLDGTMLELGRAFRWQSDLDLGPILPFDEIFASYDPSAHVNDDFFENKVAFVILLNFPRATLDEKLSGGESGPLPSGPPRDSRTDTAAVSPPT